MCVIAGYSGNKRAAPILIEMLRREQFFDGGKATGIVTIHEGKIYTAKVLGELDDLLRETDAINFPGTCGLIHSRPAANRVEHAHPFISHDGKCALVANGTLRTVTTPEWYELLNKTAQSYYDRGMMVTAYETATLKKNHLANGMYFHVMEPTVQQLGEALLEGATPEKAENAMRDALSLLPCENVSLSVHADLPGLITIGCFTRAIEVGMNGEESYLATSALAFPEDAGIEQIVSVPHGSVTQVTPGKMHIAGKGFDGIRVEPVTPRAFKVAYERLEKILSEGEPKSLGEFDYSSDWQAFWSEPIAECKYNNGLSPFKPQVALTYRVLYAFHKEGRLRGCLGEHKGSKRIKFWLENK